MKTKVVYSDNKMIAGPVTNKSTLISILFRCEYNSLAPKIIQARLVQSCSLSRSYLIFPPLMTIVMTMMNTKTKANKNGLLGLPATKITGVYRVSRTELDILFTLNVFIVNLTLNMYGRASARSE